MTYIGEVGRELEEFISLVLIIFYELLDEGVVKNVRSILTIYQLGPHQVSQSLMDLEGR